MKYNHLMTASSFVFVLLGLAFLLNGPWILSFYGIDLSAPTEPRLVAGRWPDPLMVGIAFMRLLGAMLIALGIFSWLVRNAQDASLQVSISTGFFVLCGMAFLILFLQQIPIGRIVPPLTGSSPRLLAAIFLLLSAVFGYLRFVKLSGR